MSKSTEEMKFKNTLNGHTETISHLTWLWVLLFGFIYWMVKGVWQHAMLSLILAVLTYGISWLIYPFFAKKLMIQHFLHNGWELVE